MKIQIFCQEVISRVPQSTFFASLLFIIMISDIDHSHVLHPVCQCIVQSLHLPSRGVLYYCSVPVSNVVDIVADLIHIPLPSLPVLSFSTFSLSPSNCCQAFIMRNRSLLLSRLYSSNFLIIS